MEHDILKNEWRKILKGKQEDNLQGLSSIQVKVRRQAGLDNRAVKAPSKSVWQIISSNLLLILI